MIVINFKTYLETSGENSLKMADICFRVSQKTKIKIIIAVQATDILRIARELPELPVFGQHCDNLTAGRNTGWIIPSSLKEAGAKGVFLNHSEHPLADLEQLKATIALCQKEGLDTLVFVKDLNQTREIINCQPTYIALEEPSMVAGDVAMASDIKFQSLIKEFAGLVPVMPLIGAGVKTPEDVKASLALGIKGIAFASGFAKAQDPEQLLMSLATAFL